MVRIREKLTEKELAAERDFAARITINPRKTAKPVIVAIIGLVGSGKSSVARMLAGLIGATIIEGDEIRIQLRRQGERYERSRAIAENVALRVIKNGGNAILDSDFINVKKRAILRDKARKAGVRVVFLCTYCDLDVAMGRILSEDYPETAGNFFGGASSPWQGKQRGAVVKLREMWRRIPNHYRWVRKGGGKWVIKNPPCAVIADIDTTDPAVWPGEVEKCAAKLLG